MKIKHLISAVFALALGVSAPATAATLLPDGTFTTSGDLTRVDTGSTVLEFLDLGATLGMSFASAASAFSASGFAIATFDQANELFQAFGFSSIALSDLAAGGGSSQYSDGSADDLIASVGATMGIPGLGDFSIAGFDDGAGNALSFCATNNMFGFICGAPLALADNYPTSGAAGEGVLLVRDASALAPVPLPASLPLALLGVGGLIALRRRKES